IANIPQGSYRLRVSLTGFEPRISDISIRTAVPIVLKVRLDITGQQTSVTVEAGAGRLIENVPVPSHTVDRRLLETLPAAPASAPIRNLPARLQSRPARRKSYDLMLEAGALRYTVPEYSKWRTH